MSRKSTVITLVSLTLGLLLFVMQPKARNTASSSLHGPKWSQLQPKNELIVRTHKLRPPIEVSLESSQPTPIGENSNFQLAARITALVPLSDLKYQWVLPDQISLINGADSGIFSVDPQEDFTIEANFHNATHKNRSVRLVVEKDGHIILSQVFQTERQDQKQSELKQLAQRQIELMESRPELLLPAPGEAEEETTVEEP